MIKPYNHRLMSDRNPIIFQGTGKCRFPGDHRCLFFCYHTYRDTNILERTENYEAGNDRTGMHY